MHAWLYEKREMSTPHYLHLQGDIITTLSFTLGKNAPTLVSFKTAMLTRSPFVTPSSFLLTAKKLRVEATTMAALDERPEPAGTEPVTSRSSAFGSSVLVSKNFSSTPYTEM